MSNGNADSDTAALLKKLGERIAALERHVFEQDKEMLAMSRQLEQLRSALLGLRERLSESVVDQCASAVVDDRVSEVGIYGSDAIHLTGADERPPHY